LLKIFKGVDIPEFRQKLRRNAVLLKSFDGLLQYLVVAPCSAEKNIGMTLVKSDKIKAAVFSWA